MDAKTIERLLWAVKNLAAARAEISEAQRGNPHALPAGFYYCANARRALAEVK